MAKKLIDELYKKLPQTLIPWYRKNARDLPWRKDREPYHIWLSEIMLQQTRVEAVKDYYTQFLAELPTIGVLAAAEEDRLLKLWEGLGYYNRARNLQKAARVITSENNGVFPANYGEIIKLPGIGEYTAGAIASNCFDEPVAAVDGNVLRVISRVTEDYGDILKAATKKAVKVQLEKVYPKTNCGDFTQSLMELGAIVCVPSGRPKCGVCPAEGFCLARKNATEMELPVKVKKPKRRIEERTVFILRCGDKVGVRKREAAGLLAGLWEFPNTENKQTSAQAVKIAEEWGCMPLELKKETSRKHIFSHVQWDMTCFFLDCEAMPAVMEWASMADLKRRIPLPTAFKQFLADIPEDCLKNA